jgi:hypothetical protein
LNTRGNRPHPRHHALAALVLALALTGLGCGPSQPEPWPQPTKTQQVQILQARTRLAADNLFYYELRLGEGAIHLCHSGVSLRKYPIQKITVGQPRFLHITRESDTPWIQRTWMDGELSPPWEIRRIQIIPGDERTRPTPDAAGIIPPTMEEIIPAPADFRLRFKDGLDLWFHLNGSIPYAVREPGSPWERRWADFQEAFGFGPAPRVRLRLEMDAAVGAAMFRSFPQDLTLLITL